MSRIAFRSTFQSILLLSLASGCAAAPKNLWSVQDTPYAGTAESIGFYSAGCLKGGETLPPDGKGYQLMRLGRRKYYGHPDLIAYLERLGGKVAISKKIKYKVLLIGDLGQPRGGPTPSGHMSHQSGLDVDVWFQTHEKALHGSLTLGERDTLWAPSMLASHQPFPGTLSKKLWTRDQVEYLRLAAQDDRVERIFVSAVIKREICEITKTLKPESREWVAKLRPWWGHDDHFHVRLKCPATSPLCKQQETVAIGDGCDADLDWWFSEDARQKSLEQKPASERQMPELPEACASVPEPKK